MAGIAKDPRLWALSVLICLVVCAPAQPGGPCGIGGLNRQTLTEAAGQATMVVFGALVNANPTPQPGAQDGTTDLVIAEVITGQDNLKDTRVITLPRYTEREPVAGTYRCLIFIDVFKGKLDPYRAIHLKADSRIATYLNGALRMKDQKPAKRLRYFFDYLNDCEVEISDDAHLEFTKTEYKGYRDLAKTLPADRIAGWLKDPNTPVSHLNLYAEMLGNCGNKEHGALLRKLLEDQKIQPQVRLDGILAAYVMLDRKEGWQYLKSVLHDPNRPFLQRYASLKATRLLLDYHNDLVAKKDAVEAMLPLLQMKDISDLVIDDFRRRAWWDLTDRVLALQDSPVCADKHVKRTILRFALRAVGQKAADQYVAAQRAKDPSFVEDVEEWLKDEQAASLPPNNAPRPH